MLGSKKVLSETVTSKRSYDVSFTTYGTYTYSITASSGRVSKKSADVSIKVYLPAPELTGTEPVSNGIKIKWKAMDGVPNYRVYRKTEGGSYAKVATVTGTSYVDKTAKSGTSYTYCVKAKNGSCVSAVSGKAIKFLSAITPTLANADKTIKISWKKVTGAKGYVIYRKAGSGKYAKLKSISSGSTVSFKPPVSLTNGKVP